MLIKAIVKLVKVALNSTEELDDVEVIFLIRI